jgi:hypothetical protein
MTLKVIGAGFGRTGTASLKIALETLLEGKCYHMSEVLGRAGHVDLWLDAAAGKPVWDQIFGDYVATVDYPGAFYWGELAGQYPDAKVVLSVRDAERWYTSTQETIFSHTLEEIQAGTKWGRMIKATINDHLDGDIHSHDHLVKAFNEHTQRVSAAFSPDRLLIFDAREGWGPLCQFLDVPVPEQPYPHVNSKEEFDNVFDMLRSPMGARVMDGQGMGEGSMHDEIFDTP